ncbi:MAG TPA: Fic family protein [Gemmatimonadaceae bacterium]
MRFPTIPPDTSAIREGLNSDIAMRLIGLGPSLPDGRYLHWDELRYREPPEGLTREQWWFGVRMSRRRAAQTVASLMETYGRPFSFVPLPRIQQALHQLDRMDIGQEILSALGDREAKREYRVRQLIEEAISSSEIEGARPSTREQAQKMLREARKPTTRDEHMILNNLRAMQRLRELHEDQQELTVDHLLELHRILGQGALEIPGAEGQFRGVEHNVIVEDVEGNVWYRPPPAEGLRERVEQLLSFANDTTNETKLFIHPIVRAIITHFWLGYEHPFRDGNGRIARALFYWCMLRHDYEVAEFLSISGPIERSPNAYYLAFAYTETDGEDLTYFVLHQLGVLQAAHKELIEHLHRRAARLKALATRISTFAELNHRQRSVLEHAIRRPNEGQTIEGHQNSHAVHYMTARADLNDLVARGLLTERRVATQKRFHPSEMLFVEDKQPTSRTAAKLGSRPRSRKRISKR